MSVQTIIDKANGIIADAQALSSSGGDHWPISKACLGGTAPSIPSFTNYDAWGAINTALTRYMPQLQPGFIFWLGDSVTEAWDLVQVHSASKCFGIGGDNLAGMLNRLGGYAPCLSHAGGVVLQVGINDLGYTPMATIQDYVQRLVGWFTPGIPIAMLSPLPQRNPAILSIANLNVYLSWLQGFCSGKAGLTYVDITTPVQDTDGYMKTSLTMDGIVHPNSSGYATLNSIIRPILLGWV